MGAVGAAGGADPCAGAERPFAPGSWRSAELATCPDPSWGPGAILADSSGSTTFTPGFSQRQGTTDRFLHSDWLGSTRYLSVSTENDFPSALRFDAFGNRSHTGGTDPYDPTEFQFAGGAGYETEYASTTEPGVGLQLLGNRYYDPVAGRFISQDPIGLGDYLYCGNDPADAVDPSGLDPWYDRWHNYLYGGLRVGQAWVNNGLATNGLGVLAATGVNTAGEVGIGLIDLPAQIAHLPQAWAHLGEGTGRFAANPSLGTVSGLGDDLLTVSGTYLLLEGGVRSAGKLADAIEARNPGFFSRCRRGSVRFGKTEHFDLRTAQGRRTRQVVNDMHRAGPSDVFVDKETGNFVVRGPRGREHIISPEGRGVTGIDRPNAAHLGRLRSGRIRPADDAEFARLKGLIP